MSDPRIPEGIGGDAPVSTDSGDPAPRSARIPLYVRVLIGVVLGTLCGLAFGEGPIAFGLTNKHLGDIGLLVIRLLRAMAVPLIFFGVVDAFVRTEISGRQGLKLVADETAKIIKRPFMLTSRIAHRSFTVSRLW